MCPIYNLYASWIIFHQECCSYSMGRLWSKNNIYPLFSHKYNTTISHKKYIETCPLCGRNNGQKSNVCDAWFHNDPYDGAGWLWEERMGIFRFFTAKENILLLHHEDGKTTEAKLTFKWPLYPTEILFSHRPPDEKWAGDKYKSSSVYCWLFVSPGFIMSFTIPSIGNTQHHAITHIHTRAHARKQARTHRNIHTLMHAPTNTYTHTDNI